MTTPAQRGKGQHGGVACVSLLLSTRQARLESDARRRGCPARRVSHIRELVRHRIGPFVRERCEPPRAAARATDRAPPRPGGPPGGGRSGSAQRQRGASGPGRLSARLTRVRGCAAAGCGQVRTSFLIKENNTSKSEAQGLFVLRGAHAQGCRTAPARRPPRRAPPERSLLLSLVDIRHRDVLLRELALGRVRLVVAVLALEDRLAVLIQLELGDHAL